MDKFFWNTEDGYIVLVGPNIGGEEITKDEYVAIMSAIENRPIAENGFTYKLRTDLTWELCPIPDVEDDAEATEEDYLAALAELGVSVDEEA